MDFPSLILISSLVLGDVAYRLSQAGRGQIWKNVQCTYPPWTYTNFLSASLVRFSQPQQYFLCTSHYMRNAIHYVHHQPKQCLHVMAFFIVVLYLIE